MSQHSSESWTTQEDCDKTKVLIRSLLPLLPPQIKVNPEWILVCNLSKTFGDLIKPRSENSEDEYQKSQQKIGKKRYGWKRNLFLHEQSLTALFFIVCNHVDSCGGTVDNKTRQIEITDSVEYFKYKTKKYGEPYPRLKNILNAFYKKFVSCWCNSIPLQIEFSDTVYRMEDIELVRWEQSEKRSIIDVRRRIGETIEPKFQITQKFEKFGDSHIAIGYCCNFLRVESWDYFASIVKLFLDVVDIETHKPLVCANQILSVTVKLIDSETHELTRTHELTDTRKRGLPDTHTHESIDEHGDPAVDIANFLIVRLPPLVLSSSSKKPRLE